MANRNVIYIWDPQYKILPQNYKQALEMAEKYAKVLDEPSDRLKRFAQEMAKYADAHQDELEEDVFDFLDSINYAVKEQTTIALILDLPDDNWEQALEITAEKATAKGLIVVAPELICAFLPHGKTLPPEYIRKWIASRLDNQADSDRNDKEVDTVTLDNSSQNFTPEITEKNLPKTLKQYKKWAEERFTEELSVFNFQYTQNDLRAYSDADSIFVRNVDIGQQYIIFTYHGKYPFFSQEICFAIISTIDSEIYYRFHFSEVDSEYMFHFPLYRVDEFNNRKIGNVGVNEIKETMLFLKRFVIDLLDVAVNLKGLDTLMNGDVNPLFKDKVHKAYTPHRLIISRLADNPQFEQLTRDLKQFTRDAGRNNLPMLEQWDNLVKYLREDINPETYWQKITELEQEELHLEEKRLLVLQEKFKPQTTEELTQLASQYYDTKTNLVWQRCCIGQTWLNGKVTGNPLLLSWPEVQKKLAEVKAEGWRLPTLEELKTLKFSHRIGYITKDGFAFYEKQEVSFTHWINPFQNCWNNRCEDIYIVRVNNVENPTIYDAPTFYAIEPNLRGSLRLVKTSL